MLERIPVGGWRHNEQRVVEVFAGKAKARDVVENWPRGRSTSRARSLMGSYVYMFYVDFKEQFGEIGGRHFTEDLKAHLTEERRKSEMMERWYIKERMLGRSWPPRHQLSYIYTLDWWRLEFTRRSK